MNAISFLWLFKNQTIYHRFRLDLLQSHHDLYNFSYLRLWWHWPDESPAAVSASRWSWWSLPDVGAEYEFHADAPQSGPHLTTQNKHGMTTDFKIRTSGLVILNSSFYCVWTSVSLHRRVKRKWHTRMAVSWLVTRCSSEAYDRLNHAVHVPWCIAPYQASIWFLRLVKGMVR